MRLPSGFADTVAARTRVDSGRSLGQVRLVVDRLVTPWDAAAVERTLLDGRAFGTGAHTTLSDRLRGQQGRTRLRLGLAKQSEETDETRMMYAIADLGDEVVVARYVASADDVAFNFSVLRDSLLSLEATLLTPHPLDAPLGVQMSAVPAAGERPPIAVVPANTSVELAVSAGCGGSTAPAGSLVATLDVDFTVRFVASWWAAGTSATDLKRECLGPDAAASTLRTKHFGVTWVAERIVVTTAAGLPALLESWAPEAESPHTRDALLAWGRAVER
jgi:hypothetical protein